MAALKNQHWETFSQKFVEFGDATKAMVAAFPNRAKWRKESQYAAASELFAKPVISKRIAEIQAELAEMQLVDKSEIIRLCARVMRGELIPDFQEESDDKPIKVRTIPKTWAIERICKMSGFDSPTEVELTKKEQELSRDEMIAEIERLQRTRGNSSDD